jgi:hypothetical protein
VDEREVALLRETVELRKVLLAAVAQAEMVAALLTERAERRAADDEEGPRR